MTHYSVVAPTVFAKIKSGAKIIEPRLNDDAHRRLRLGDLMIVTNHATKEELVTKVVGLMRYKTFAELFTIYEPRYFGVGDTAEIEAEVRNWYAKHDEQEHGVIGIKLHRLAKEI